jgi:predicted extracellular nuclease
MQKKKIFNFTFLFLLFSPLFSSGIIITEIQIEGESANECFIKIYNPENKEIDISGYKLRKKTSSGTDSSIRVFPKGSFIKSNSFFLWGSSKEKSYPEKIGADVSSIQTLSKNNSIALLNKEGELIDAVSWGEGENAYILGNPLENPENGQIIKRKIDNKKYLQTEDNFFDFYLYPPTTSPSQIEKTYSEKEEKKNKSPLFISFLSSIIIASIVLYLKKNVWTQSL